MEGRFDYVGYTCDWLIERKCGTYVVRLYAQKDLEFYSNTIVMPDEVYDAGPTTIGDVLAVKFWDLITNAERENQQPYSA